MNSCSTQTVNIASCITALSQVANALGLSLAEFFQPFRKP